MKGLQPFDAFAPRVKALIGNLLRDSQCERYGSLRLSLHEAVVVVPSSDLHRAFCALAEAVDRRESCPHCGRAGCKGE